LTPGCLATIRDQDGLDFVITQTGGQISLLSGDCLQVRNVPEFDGRQPVWGPGCLLTLGLTDSDAESMASLRSSQGRLVAKSKHLAH
jgi:hypothetical protein